MILLGLVIFAGWIVQQRKIAYARQEYVRVAEAGKAASESGTEGIDQAGADTEGDVQKADAEKVETGEVTTAADWNLPSKEEETTVPEETEAVQEDIVLLFAGDVYLSSHVLSAYEKAGGISGVLDEGIRKEIEDADIFMVNQEFPFTNRGTAAADKQFTFRLPPEKVSMMQEMGIDIVTIANNHILDFGEVGLLDSCQVLDEAGIPYVGGGENFSRAKQLETLEVGGMTIGFLGTSRVYMDVSWAAGNSHPGVFSTYDPTLAIAAIEKAKEQCDYLVVYVHWGVEKETTPKEYQRTMGRQYIDAGADLVVGSHPHVLQDIEYYNGKPIVHSLGNFVFGSSIPKTALLKVELAPEALSQGRNHVREVSGSIVSGGVVFDNVELGSDAADGAAKITLIPCTSSAGYTRLAQ